MELYRRSRAGVARIADWHASPSALPAPPRVGSICCRTGGSGRAGGWVGGLPRRAGCHARLCHLAATATAEDGVIGVDPERLLVKLRTL